METAIYVVAVTYKNVTKVIAQNIAGQYIVLDEKDCTEINTQSGVVKFKEYHGLFASPLKGLYDVVSYALLLIDIDEKVKNGCNRLTATLACSIGDDEKAAELAKAMLEE